MLGLWFMGVILIPPIWPRYSLVLGHFNDWWDTVIYQATKE
jgi:hypothetical protein